MTTKAKNPNARASFIVGIVASVIVWTAHKLGWTLESYYATIASTSIVSAALWVGREGIRGAWRRIWDGRRS